MDAKTPQKLKDVIASMGNQPIRMIADKQELRQISKAEYLSEVGEEQGPEQSNNIRELLAKAVKNRPRTDPKKYDKFYL